MHVLTPKKDTSTTKSGKIAVNHGRFQCRKSIRMADRRTKRNRTRTSQNRAAIYGD